MAYLIDMPKFGFGTAYDIGAGENQLTQLEFRSILKKAIDMGCRHIDCAPLYGTQGLVGAIVELAISEQLTRDNFFISSKLPTNMMRYDKVRISLVDTLTELNLKYLDLFLIHAPFATQHVDNDVMYPTDSEGNLLLDESDQVLELAWKRLAELKREGFVRYIGLSNVNIEQVSRLNAINHIDVVQNEYHLYNQDHEMVNYCEEINVHFEAYSAMGSPKLAEEQGKPKSLDDPTVERIASANGLTKAEVVVQWLHKQPISYVIRSDNEEQLRENINACKKMALSSNDMIDLDGLNQNSRLYLFNKYKNITQHREYPFRERSSGVLDELAMAANEPVSADQEVSTDSD